MKLYKANVEAGNKFRYEFTELGGESLRDHLLLDGSSIKKCPCTESDNDFLLTDDNLILDPGVNKNYGRLHRFIYSDCELRLWSYELKEYEFEFNLLKI